MPWTSLLPRNPLLRALLPGAAAAIAINAAVGIPSTYVQSERFFDLTGSAGFVAVAGLSLYLPALRARALAAAAGLATPPAWPSLAAPFRSWAAGAGSPAGTAFNWRQVVVTGAVVVWACRLGSYLFSRILASGHDSRFEKIRGSPSAMATIWTGQAMWITFNLLPVLALNGVPAAALASAVSRAAAGPTLTDVVGLALFAGGFALEVAADAQKSAWLKGRREKTHDEQFLTKGLYSVCRYPNYLGEITLWTGLATVAAGAMMRAPVLAALGLPVNVVGQAVVMALCAASPAFTTWALLSVTGVPLSEEKYDKLYGDRKDYQEWKKNTPKILPKLF